MRKRKYRIRSKICVLLAVLMGVLSMPVSAKAEVYWPEAPSMNTPSIAVVEVNSGAVLYEKNSNAANYPASITKVMTTLLALENCGLDEVVTFSDDAINLNQGDTSHIARDYGEQMTMEECLYAVMLESANECSYAVAEHVGTKLGGDYRTFIDMMNEKAKELGCTNTHFNNSNGLPDEQHWTSAHDMALIAAEAFRNENFRIIVGTRSYRIPPTNRHDEITPLNNHHAMISNYKTNKYIYEYCKGGKTGYTQQAGSTLVTYAEKDGITLACVVMNTNSTDQYVDTKAVFEYCFENFKAVPISQSDEESEQKNEDHGIMGSYDSFVKADEDAYIVLPVSAEMSNLTSQLEVVDHPGDVIAQIKYYYGEHLVGAVDIISSGATIEDHFFIKENTSSDKNVIVINSAMVVTAVILLIILIVAIIFGKRLYDNYYVILHDLDVRKQRRSRFRPIRKKKKRWRKRDRMFK